MLAYARGLIIETLILRLGIMDQSQQRMPRSLGLTLRVMRIRAGLSQAVLAAKLDGLPARFRDQQRAICKDDISRAERSLRLYYFLLHQYVGWSGLPAGMIYLLSRCGADLRDGKVKRVQRIARALRGFADYIERNAEDLAKVVVPDLAATAPNTEREALARQVVLDYRREVDIAGPSPTAVEYEGSAQQRDDARLALIVDKIIAHLERPLRRGVQEN